MTSITLPPGYSQVALLAGGVLPVFAFLHGLATTIFRAKAGILYPQSSATLQQEKASPAAFRFNCALRAHAQLMENLPQTMVMLLLGGLGYPVATRNLGLAWVLMRSLYWVGYISSSLEKRDRRMYGMLFWFAQGGIWALGLRTAWGWL